MPPCIHMKKMAKFLWELEQKKTVTPETQETYSYYTHKRAFWETINYLEEKGVIMVMDNNGIPTIKLTRIYGSLIMWIFNHLCDVNAEKDFVLSP